MEDWLKKQSDLKRSEAREIAKARAAAGLSVQKSKDKRCLRCDKKFRTIDPKNQHTCDYCREALRDKKLW